MNKTWLESGLQCDQGEDHGDQGQDQAGQTFPGVGAGGRTRADFKMLRKYHKQIPTKF